MTHASSWATIAHPSIGWSVALSILMIAAGLLAMIVPPAAGIAVTIMVGWLLICSGGAHLVFGWHTRSEGGLIWELLLGILYIVVGGYMLLNLAAGLASLTLALAVYLLVEAVLEVILYFQMRPLPGSGWLLLDGAVTLLLAILIWRAWPSSVAWVIGFLVGISMLVSGVSRLALTLFARRMTRTAT